MKKRTFLFNLILTAFFLGTVFSMPVFAGESDGPGMYTGTVIGKGPRITTAPAAAAVVEEETTAEKSSPVTGAGEVLSAPAELEGEVATVETVTLAGQKSWEERVAADLLLEKRPKPRTGELFHSEKCLSTSATVVITNFGNDDTLIKFFSQDDEPVFVVYIRKGEKLNVQIPGGYYKMNQAFGETWYGTAEMFGNCGRYCECSIDGQTLFNIKRGGKYVISTMGLGDAFSKKEVLREDF